MSDDEAAAAREGEWLWALGLHRPELRAWAMYDWANSAMLTTVVTAVFPIFFTDVSAAGLPPGIGAERFSIASTLGMVIVAVLAPLLGTLADERPIKKVLLAAFLALGVASVSLMFFLKRGDWQTAALLFILANIGANGSFGFYDALLPHVARPHEIDRVSTAGYALGYIGGGTMLALNLAWIMKPGWFGLPSGPGLTPDQQTLPARLAFLSVGVWWLVFSVPLFLKVPEPPVVPDRNAEGRPARPVAAAFSRLGGTFRELRRYRNGFLMLLAFLIYNDGVGTIIRMATVYGNELKIPQTAMIASIVIVQFVGIPFAFIFGALAGRFGVKPSIVLGLAVYIGISVFGYFMKTSLHFLILAVAVGMVQGGTQALSRSLFASMIPPERSGEFFGFFAVVEKFAGIAGPLLFGLSIRITGQTRDSILTVIPFFLVGGALLMFVDPEEGKREARAVEAAETQG
ncbi:MAG: MFS transporter [Isosphaeraceae bacterium]